MFRLRAAATRSSCRRWGPRWAARWRAPWGRTPTPCPRTSSTRPRGGPPPASPSPCSGWEARPPGPSWCRGDETWAITLAHYMRSQHCPQGHERGWQSFQLPELGWLQTRNLQDAFRHQSILQGEAYGDILSLRWGNFVIYFSLLILLITRCYCRLYLRSRILAATTTFPCCSAPSDTRHTAALESRWSEQSLVRT